MEASLSDWDLLAGALTSPLQACFHTLHHVTLVAVASLYGLLGKIAHDIDHAGEGSTQQDGKRKRPSQKGQPAPKPGTAKAGAEQGRPQHRAGMLQQAILVRHRVVAVAAA